MNNLDFLNNADIAAKGLTLLNKDGVDVSTLSTEDKLESLAVLLTYRDMLEEKFNDRIKEFEDSIDNKDFDSTIKVGSHKVTFKVKEVVNAKALGLTNKELKDQYGIADSIISVDQKEIVTLHKDKLEEAIANNIPQVCDAIRDGKLVFNKDNAKTSSVK